MDENSVNVQWYPGHMAKAMRMISENMKLVDIVCEIIDARIPKSSRNPELDAVTGGKPRLIIMNRTDQADPSQTKLWVKAFKESGYYVLETDARSGRGVAGFPQAARSVLKEKLEAYIQKGQVGRSVRAMVAGIPNVGKSTFINKAAKRKAAAVSDRPGVTRGKQWITVDNGLELLDTPGVLWPRFETPELGEHLAFTGAVKDAVTDTEALAARLMSFLRDEYPEMLTVRYKIDINGADGFTLLERAARKRGFLISGGEMDLERMAAILLDEFRGGVIGRITLDRL